MNWKYWLILIISVIILIIAPGLFTQTAIFDFGNLILLQVLLVTQ